MMRMGALELMIPRDDEGYLRRTARVPYGSEILGSQFDESTSTLWVIYRHSENGFDGFEPRSFTVQRVNAEDQHAHGDYLGSFLFGTPRLLYVVLQS